MFGIGGMELIVIFLVLLLLFGAKRLPEIARSLGRASNEFKKAKQEFTSIADESPPSQIPRQTSSAQPSPTPEAAASQSEGEPKNHQS
jgi:sec-independent protein translocase protein TatA